MKRSPAQFKRGFTAYQHQAVACVIENDTAIELDVVDQSLCQENVIDNAQKTWHEITADGRVTDSERQRMEYLLECADARSHEITTLAGNSLHYNYTVRQAFDAAWQGMDITQPATTKAYPALARLQDDIANDLAEDTL